MALVMFLNTVVPWASLFTSVTGAYNTDCYDSCGITIVAILFTYWYVSLLIWGFPFFCMGMYSIFGRGMGLKGNLIKFQILYSTRYLGLLWHILGSVLGIYYAILQWDLLFGLVFAVTGYFLEVEYLKHGAGAVNYLDPEWTQSENAIYPFTV